MRNTNGVGFVLDLETRYYLLNYLMSETPGISILIVISLIIGDQNLSLFIAH
jgi:hypothetical protein